MHKLFSLILILAIQCFSELMIGAGCSYDPVIDDNVQVATSVGILKSFAFENAISTSLEVQAPVLALQNVNLNVPLILYYRHLTLTGACSIYLQNLKQDIENQDIKYKFSTGLGLFYNIHNFFIRPTILYDITNKEFGAQILILKLAF